MSGPNIEMVVCNVCNVKQPQDVITCSGECRKCFSDRIVKSLNDGTHGNPQTIARLKREGKL